MVKQASLQWNRLRRYLIADPGRFAGGSAVSDPLGLLVIERVRRAARTRVRPRVFPGRHRRPT